MTGGLAPSGSTPNPKEDAMVDVSARALRVAKVMRRSVKGAIWVGSAEGRGVIGMDARKLASEAAARALAIAKGPDA